MIIGVGVDTTTVSRIEKSRQSDHFMERVFSDRERVMFARRGNKSETIAVNFAAKEAFGKALGTGLSGFNWVEVAILRTEVGAPYFIYEGKMLEMMTKHRWRAKVSLTHEDEIATAFVIIEEL